MLWDLKRSAVMAIVLYLMLQLTVAAPTTPISDTDDSTLQSDIATRAKCRAVDKKCAKAKDCCAVCCLDAGHRALPRGYGS